VKVNLYSTVVPSRNSFCLADLICLYVRVLCRVLEVPLRGQARYGKPAFLKLLVSLNEDDDDYYYCVFMQGF